MTKKIILLFSIFLMAWSVGYIWSKWRYTVTDGAVASARLLDCEAEKIQKITIRKIKTGLAPESIVFLKKNDIDSSWSFVEPNLGEATWTILQRVASMACSNYDPEAAKIDASALGVDQESTMLELFDGEKTFSLQMGPNLPGRTTLVAVGDLKNKKFYKILSTLKELISMPPELFQNHKVMRVSGDNILELCTTFSPQEKYCFSREGADWVVAKNAKNLGHGSEEANKYINRLATLNSIKVLEIEKKWEACLADLSQKPGNLITVSIGGVAGRTETIIFSKKVQKEKNGKSYLRGCSSARESVFGIHPDLLKYLKVDLTHMLVKKL